MVERRFKHTPEGMWWVAEARCVGQDPDLFFPVGSSGPAAAQVEAAKRVCATCRVRADCLEWSLSTYQDAGVWGGLDEEERREIRRARRRVATGERTDELVAV